MKTTGQASGSPTKSILDSASFLNWETEPKITKTMARHITLIPIFYFLWSHHIGKLVVLKQGTGWFSQMQKTTTNQSANLLTFLNVAQLTTIKPPRFHSTFSTRHAFPPAPLFRMQVCVFLLIRDWSRHRPSAWRRRRTEHSATAMFVFLGI